MKRLPLTIILSLFSLQFYGQEYLPIDEYKKLEYISTANIILPEYTIKDSCFTKVVAKFMEEEKKQEYYHDGEYILIDKYAKDTLNFMSIYPNMLNYSFYGGGRYDGVIYLEGQTFILSLRDQDSSPFTYTGNMKDVEFLKYNRQIWPTLPDPYENWYLSWVIIYYPETDRWGEKVMTNKRKNMTVKHDESGNIILQDNDE